MKDDQPDVENTRDKNDWITSFLIFFFVGLYLLSILYIGISMFIDAFKVF